ncbi:MAG: hypothetical protein ABI666_06275 [Ferruginibacter sp.]
MTKVAEKENNIQKRNFFDYVTEVIGWLQIVFFPLSLAGILGFFIYISNPSATRLILGIGITIIGLILGIILATKIWKKRGTINFISRVSASPELDDIDNE